MTETSAQERDTIDVLWLDDLVGYYKTFIAALGKRNIRITKAKTCDQAIRLAKAHDYDLHLVDLKLQRGTGLDFIEAMEKQKPGINICILSSYLYLTEYRGIVERHRSDVGVIDKDIPAPSSHRFDMFSDKIVAMATKGAASLQRKAVEIDVEKVNPLRVTYDEYAQLSGIDKDRLHVRAYEKLERKLKPLFDAGSQWVLFLGDDNDPIVRAYDEEEIWSDDQIYEAAVEHNRVPFQFREPVAVDDHGACGGGSKNASYPTVTFVWTDSDGKHRQEFSAHFDTGSYDSYLSFEHWTAISGEPSPGYRSVMTYRGRTIVVYDKKLELRIADQADRGHERSVDLNVILVKDWLQSPFVMTCPLACPRVGLERSTSGFNCRRRKGLIGRRLIVDNALPIRLSAPELKTLLT